MTGRLLPPEIVSLVHHVELNKVGWWERSFKQIIVGTIWLSSRALTVEELKESLKKDLRVSIPAGKLSDLVEDLLRENILVPVPSDRFRISQQNLEAFEGELRETEQIEEQAKEKFYSGLRDCCPELAGKEEIWTSFRSGLLGPLVSELGARTYEMISGESVNLESSVRLSAFLEGYPTELRQSLRNAVIAFINPRDALIRSYFLRYLNAHFFVEATNLSSETLSKVYQLITRRPVFRIFVDTNFLFSILGLHENPSNEAAIVLATLINSLGGRIDGKLFVLPPTVLEARRVIAAVKRDLGPLPFSPSLARGAIRLGESGMIQKFFDDLGRTARPISADSYFSPYELNLIAILRSKGVELFNARLDPYKTRQDVVDDINRQLEFEMKHFGDRAKGYEAVEHDMILWHFVREKRRGAIDSPLEAEYWIVTVDYRYLGFDAYKCRNSLRDMAVCLHPTALIQMLQFWVPRTPELEEAAVGSIRLPFLFQRFSPAAEKVTLRILSTLARFEAIGDMSDETITQVLLNEGLRQKISVERDASKQIDLVKEAILEEEQKLRSKLAEARGEIARLQGEAGQRSRELEEAKAGEKSERETRLSTERRVWEIENRLEKQQQQTIRKRERILFGLSGTVALFLCLILPFPIAGGVELLLPKALRDEGLKLVAMVALVLVGAWLLLIDYFGSKWESIASWWPYTFLRRFRKWSFGVLAALSIAVVGAILGSVLLERGSK